jgi:hypothetical protein
MTSISVRRLQERVTNIEAAVGDAPRDRRQVDDGNDDKKEGKGGQSRFAGGVAAQKERKRIELAGHSAIERLNELSQTWSVMFIIST